MTLNELGLAVSTLIDMNNRQFPNENRNDLPVTFRLGIFGPLRKNGRRGYKTKLYKIDYLERGVLGVGNHKVTCLYGQEEMTAKTGEKA